PGWAGGREAEHVPCWLGTTVARLPAGVQTAAGINEALGKPAGWLGGHAGIRQRCVWGGQGPLASAAAAAQGCLHRTDLLVEQGGALLVTSEAPPLLAGLGAALHHRLGLRPDTVALEIGGACTGYLAALWTARAILPRVGVALVVAVEAPSRLLALRPGPAGGGPAPLRGVAGPSGPFPPPPRPPAGAAPGRPPRAHP